MTLTITVGGDPEMYDVRGTGDEYIPLASFASAEYTIKATDDKNGQHSRLR